MPRTLSLLFLLCLSARQAYSQADPCRREQARAASPALGITLDSLRLTALRPTGPCRIVAEGRYRGRLLAVLGWQDGALTDTISLPPDSAPTQLVPWQKGALRVRLGWVAPVLGLTYVGPQGPSEAWPISLLDIKTLGVLPPLAPDAGPEEAARYQNTRVQVLAAGSDAETLALLVRRIERPCLQAGCCLPDRWTYWLVLLPGDALGRPTALGVQVWAIPPGYCPSAPAPPCLGKSATEPEEAGRLLSAGQPVVRLRGAWVLNTGRALLAAQEGTFTPLALPPGVRPAHVWAEGGEQQGRLYYRRGGRLRQAAEQEAFRMRERYVIAGLAEAPLTLRGNALEMGSAHKMDLADALATQGQPLAWMAGYWWLAGYGRVKPSSPNAR